MKPTKDFPNLSVSLISQVDLCNWQVKCHLGDDTITVKLQQEPDDSFGVELEETVLSEMVDKFEAVLPGLATLIGALVMAYENGEVIGVALQKGSRVQWTFNEGRFSVLTEQDGPRRGIRPSAELDELSVLQREAVLMADEFLREAWPSFLITQPLQ